MNYRLVLAVVIVVVTITGCGPSFGPRAQYGVAFYCPGAGNIDFGDQGVRQGLERAGYRGQVASVMWTVSFNPAIDQALRINAHLGASRLASFIKQYIEQYPGRPVNLIGLSAGTGVAIWALEDLDPQYQVDNVVLLSSSLHHKYDVGKALKRVKGKIYNYYSSEDPILAGPMKIFGTIDGVFFEDGAGAVGLHSPTGAERIVNIPWQPEFKQYGYHGMHTDVTSPAFVQARISQHINSQAALQTKTATVLVKASRPAHPD
ncbi:MAG: alpha/beta hydrolase [Planctomycetota bacterium]